MLFIFGVMSQSSSLVIEAAATDVKNNLLLAVTEAKQAVIEAKQNVMEGKLNVTKAELGLEKTVIGTPTAFAADAKLVAAEAGLAMRQSALEDRQKELATLVAASVSTGGGGGAGVVAPSFETDISLLENLLRRVLTPLQREAFRAREFEYARVALRERRFDTSRDSCALLLSQLDGRVKTTTQRRLSTTAGGLYLDGLLAGGDVRGRLADLFCAVRVNDGAVGAAKVYYAPPPGFDHLADCEWRTSQVLDGTATGGSLDGLTRSHVIQYSDRLDLGRGRIALFMPLYVRSLYQLVNESHSAVPLPSPFLMRVASDILRGLTLMHSAGYAHCDVKADNIMFDGSGAATLIDLGAATRFGEPTLEGVPESMALGRDVSVGSAAVDLACLASTLWWAARRFDAATGMSATKFADYAEAQSSDGEPVLRAVAIILRAESAAAALAVIQNLSLVSR